MLGIGEREAFLARVEQTLDSSPDMAAKALDNLFPKDINGEVVSKVLFSLIPPGLFQRVILHLEQGMGGTLWPRYFYRLVSDEQFKALDISSLKITTIIRLFKTGLLGDLQENRRRFALLNADVVFNTFLGNRFPSSEPEFTYFCDLISNEQLKQCPLLSFSLLQFKRLFLSGSLGSAKRMVQQIPPSEIERFFRRHRTTVRSNFRNVFLGLCSEEQKRGLSALVIADAMTAKRRSRY